MDFRYADPMCVSSNLRCGSCLAKWNGKAWEESFKCIFLLKSWTLVLNEEHQLCVEGQCDVNFNLSVRVPITECLNSYWVRSDHTLVKLRGILNTKNVPKYVAEKFSRGVPQEWQEIAKTWVEFIQQGRRGSFNWAQNESFASSDTSIILSRIDRNLSSGKNGKTKEKSVQSVQQETRRTVELERDSAVPSSKCSVQNQQVNSTSTDWACPWLPAHKIQEISQWIDCSHVTPAPSEDAEMNLGISGRNSSFDLSSLSDRGSNRISQKRREQNFERITQNPSNIVPQSTPLSIEHNSATVAQALNFNLSSIASNTQGTDSPESDLVDGVFRKPKIAVPADKVPSSKSNVSVKSGSKDSQAQSSLRSKRSNNSETLGRRLGQVYSRHNRNQKKQSLQKIERWRPVLGVDGQLKVQGYLLLSGDMTAGQILTTNTVVQWGFRKVETCDGREYELVGDPYEKIPDKLRNSLLKPTSCEKIICELRQFQSLKEDVSSCPYLAPPPAPTMMTVTRSGRMCRPRAPYWLNRSDWGAEYELFYGNDSAYGTGDSRMSNSSRSDTRATRNVVSKSQRTDTQVQRSPAAACDSKETSKKAETAFSQSGDSQEYTSSSESMSSPFNSPVRKSSRITERQLRGKYLSWRNKTRRRIKDRSSALNSSNESCTNASNRNDIVNENSEKDGNKRRSADGIQSRSENITRQGPQNQMMLPSLRLASESSIVHFSPSRIKVSYLSNIEQKEIQTLAQRSSTKRLMFDESTDTSEDSLALMQSQSPAGPSGLPLSRTSSVSSICPSHSTCQSIQRSSQKVRTQVRVTSQSSVSRITSRRSLQDRENLNKTTNLANKTSKNSVAKGFVRTPVIGSSIKAVTKTTATSTLVTEAPATKISQVLDSKTPFAESGSAKTFVSKTLPSETQIIETPTRKTSSSRRSLSKLATTKASAKKTAPTENPGGKTPATGIAPAKTSASKTCRVSARKNKDNKTPTSTTDGETPASKDTRYFMRSATPSTKRTSQTKMTEPWVILQRLNVQQDSRNVLKTNEEELIPKTQKRKSVTTKAKSVKKIVSSKSVKKKGRPKKKIVSPQSVKRRGRPKKKNEESTKKKTSKTFCTKGSGKNIENERSFDETDKDTVDNASECSDVSDISLGPSASVIFALNSPEPRRAPRTLKERRERDEKLKEMQKRLAAREPVIEDDDPMANLFATYKFASFPEEWCRHENILHQNRKRRRPSSSDGTTSPHPTFDDGFGNEDATSSVATPQLLMRPPDPKQVQSYLQRQRALNSRPQRPTRQVNRNKNLVLPHMDYVAVFRDDNSDSEISSLLSEND